MCTKKPGGNWEIERMSRFTYVGGWPVKAEGIILLSPFSRSSLCETEFMHLLDAAKGHGAKCVFLKKYICHNVIALMNR